MYNLLDEIFDERKRQETLKAEGKFLWTCSDKSRSNAEKLAVLLEEVGEAAKEVVEEIIQIDKAAAVFPSSSMNIRDTKVDLRKELIQVAAVCVAWLEALDE